jgi:hypothetical protein
MQDEAFMCRKRIARFLLEHEDNTCRGAFTKSHATKKKGNPDQPKQNKQKVGVYQRRSLAFTCLEPFILPDSNLGSLFNRFLKLTMTRIRMTRLRTRKETKQMRVENLRRRRRMGKQMRLKNLRRRRMGTTMGARTRRRNQPVLTKK